jgi:hypothetical protein
MAMYNKEQSTVVALWVLAMSRYPTEFQTAPDAITAIVNKLGDSHTSDSVLLHKHGYDRLLLDRPINKNISALQRQVARELHDVGIAPALYDA